VDEKFSMRTPKVTKKFRFLYNKGVVHDDDDGTITRGDPSFPALLRDVV